MKLLSITARRNVLGGRPSIADMIRLARDAGALTLVDAAQSVAHHQTDVQALDCDFLAFSGHKLYGPQGIGVLYGKQKLLQAMPPFLGGGMMIWDVTTDSFTPTDIPAKFEAGTQPVAGAAGLQAAIEWLSQFAWKDIEAHEHSLLLHAAEELRNIHGLHLLGPWQTKNEQSFGSAQDRRANEPTSNATSGCLSFTIDGIHPHDLTDILCKQGICLRAGRHCAQPLHKALGVNASTRLSVGIYNTFEEIVAARHGILQAVAMLS